MSRFAVVTVTYNPSDDVLARQLAGLAGASAVVIVDNASAPPGADAVRRCLAAVPQATLVQHGRNLGLAAALNAGAGAALARAPDCDYLLFLDQDTEPGDGGARRLVDAAAALRARDPRARLVGPLVVDAATGLSHGVHVIRGWSWRRVYPEDGAAPVRCASVNGSGMVVAVDTWRALGGFDEALFIDHVDSEYSFRASHAGVALYTIPAVRFAHRMGERSLRFWLGGWRVWPYRAPARHYYLFRNAMVLMRRPSTPVEWKIWVPVKLLLTACVHALIGDQRAAQLRAMFAGLSAGLGKGRPALPRL